MTVNILFLLYVSETHDIIKRYKLGITLKKIGRLLLLFNYQTKIIEFY